MIATEPTRPADEHTDAVARAITVTTRDGNGRRVVSKDVALTVARAQARALLTSTDPRVHEALAANLPAEAMLDALVRAGVLTEDAEDIIGFHDETCPDPCPFGKRRRLVTPWEVAP